MENIRTLGVILLAIGVMTLVLAIGADVIGLGQTHAFGFKQIAGAVAGVLVATIGSFLVLQKQASGSGATSRDPD